MLTGPLLTLSALPEWPPETIATLVPVNVPFNAAPGMVTNLAGVSGNLDALISRTNLLNRTLNLGNNLYDLRLTFDWPVYLNQSGVRVGANRKVFRTLVSGSLVTNGVSYLPGVTFYFLQPSQFVFIR